MTASNLLGSLERLARVPPTDVNHLQHIAEFKGFRELLRDQHPQLDSGSLQRFTLATTLRQLGLASLVGGIASDLAASSKEVLGQLDQALRGASSKRRHLCPLNLGIGSAGAVFWPKSGADLFAPRARRAFRRSRPPAREPAVVHRHKEIRRI